MKKALKKILRPFVWLFISVIYLWGCHCYDKKYLTGKYFDRWHFTKGWHWILQYWFSQKIMRKNSHVPWPVPPYVLIANPQNIIFNPDDMDNFHTVGNYFQGINAKIYIGSGTMIAAGTGIITANHSLENIEKSDNGKDVVIGKKCVIGMNAVILPGVVLGDNTIVGAGAIVTKSFPEGNCVIAGNPANIIRKIY